MNRYPPPGYAATVWTNGEALNVYFDGTGPNGQGHSIALPATEHGLRQLLVILRERARASASELRIGHRAAPIQYDLDEVIRVLDRKKAEIDPRLSNALAALKRITEKGGSTGPLAQGADDE